MIFVYFQGAKIKYAEGKIIKLAYCDNPMLFHSN